MGIFNFTHVLRSQQFDRWMLETFFDRVDAIKYDFLHARGDVRKRLSEMLMFAVFYEPSTRTRFSFEAGAHHLGMHVVSTENAEQFSSSIKGETLEHTIRTMCGYFPDVIVLRHKDDGAADRAAGVIDKYVVDKNRHKVSIINAGDGMNQHPTQALLDLYTIRRKMGKLDGLTVIVGGDLEHGRTVKSLVYLLAKFDNNRLIFVSPDEFRIGENIKEHLTEHGVEFREETELEKVLPDADVVYWTRIQKERMKDSKLVDSVRKYVIGSGEIGLFKESAILMHPMPIAGEIGREVDDDPHAVYFEQSQNGLFVRMTLLLELLSKK